MKRGPAVSELGWRWVTGQLDAEEYFGRVRRRARTRAWRQVEARLAAVRNGDHLRAASLNGR